MKHLFDGEEFRAWLRSQGADVLAPTNQWEVVRFRARGAVHIVYTDARKNIKASGFAAECMEACRRGGNLSMGFTSDRKSLGARMKAALLARDGDLCFFCARVMTQEEMTVEHLVGIGKGWPNHTDNFALAHEECNKKAGNMPLMEKIVTAAVSRGANWNYAVKEEKHADGNL